MLCLRYETDTVFLRADYINDGVYGAFNCTLFDHQVVHPVVLTLSDVFQDAPAFDKTETCSVWGTSAGLLLVSSPRLLTLALSLRSQDPPATRLMLFNRTLNFLSTF